jgi:hypothetical protein
MRGTFRASGEGAKCAPGRPPRRLAEVATQIDVAEQGDDLPGASSIESVKDPVRAEAHELRDLDIDPAALAHALLVVDDDLLAAVQGDLQYVPAFGSVTNLPTFPMHASREWTKFWRRQEPLGPGREAGATVALRRHGRTVMRFFGRSSAVERRARGHGISAPPGGGRHDAGLLGTRVRERTSVRAQRDTDGDLDRGIALGVHALGRFRGIEDERPWHGGQQEVQGHVDEDRADYGSPYDSIEALSVSANAAERHRAAV